MGVTSLRTRASALPLLLAGLAWTPRASAGPDDVARLEYSRSEQAAAVCPDRAALESGVRTRLGYSPFFPGARRTVVVEVLAASDGLHARLRLLDRNGIVIGSRELHESVEQCDELVASLALAISIALDPNAAANPQPELPGSAPATSSEPSPRDEEPPAAVLEPGPAVPEARVPVAASSGRSSSALQQSAGHSGEWAVRAAAFAALGAAPAPAFGFRVGASRRWGWFQLSAEFVDQLPASKTIEHLGGARTKLLSALLAPCVTVGWLAGCAVLDVGSLHAQGLRILDVAEERRLNVALGARLEWTPTLVGPLQLLANLDLAASLTPVTLRVHGQKIWANPALSPAAGLGLKLLVP